MKTPQVNSVESDEQNVRSVQERFRVLRAVESDVEFVLL